MSRSGWHGVALRMQRASAGIALVLALAGCQASQPGAIRARAGTPDAIAQLASSLPGQYDNHEQFKRDLAAQAKAGGTVALHVRQSLRVVERGREEISWLWQLQAVDQKQLESIWLMRAHQAADGRHARVVPYRAVDAAAARSALADSAQAFRFDPAQWAALDACAQDGEWDGVKFSAAADRVACGALLPGLGEDGALLPLRMVVAADMIQVATFADLSRGPDAVEEARRVRRFSGWAAINGGGPRATADNQDWHMQADLRLSSEGERAPLRWRDGAPSGYSLVLERTDYPERKLSVLQLNVIDDSSGKTLTYVWADLRANAIGLNLGWLQGGFTEQPPAVTR